jgi:Flp pilus assembly protein TadB
MSKEISTKNATPTAWDQQGNNLKTMWVASVLLFWLSVAIQVAIYFLTGEINLILVSIALGLMILGVALKIRYQRHLRSKPKDPKPPIEE